jgi:hypothetical protein
MKEAKPWASGSGAEVEDLEGAGFGEGVGEERKDGAVGVGAVPDGLEGVCELVAKEGRKPGAVVEFE